MDQKHSLSLTFLHMCMRASHTQTPPTPSIYTHIHTHTCTHTHTHIHARTSTHSDKNMQRYSDHTAMCSWVDALVCICEGMVSAVCDYVWERCCVDESDLALAEHMCTHAYVNTAQHAFSNNSHNKNQHLAASSVWYSHDKPNVCLMGQPQGYWLSLVHLALQILCSHTGVVASWHKVNCKISLHHNTHTYQSVHTPEGTVN